MINADVVGNELFKQFVKEEFVDGSQSFFDPIKISDLKTGLKKKHKVFFPFFFSPSFLFVSIITDVRGAQEVAYFFINLF